MLLAQVTPDQLAAAAGTIKIAAGIVAVVVPIFSAGAAFAAVRVGQNGMRGDIREIRDDAKETRGDVKGLVVSVGDLNARLTGVEVTQEAHAGWIRRIEETANPAAGRREKAR